MSRHLLACHSIGATNVICDLLGDPKPRRVQRCDQQQGVRVRVVLAVPLDRADEGVPCDGAFGDQCIFGQNDCDRASSDRQAFQTNFIPHNCSHSPLHRADRVHR